MPAVATVAPVDLATAAMATVATADLHRAEATVLVPVHHLGQLAAMAATAELRELLVAPLEQQAQAPEWQEQAAPLELRATEETAGTAEPHPRQRPAQRLAVTAVMAEVPPMETPE